MKFCKAPLLCAASTLAVSWAAAAQAQDLETAAAPIEIGEVIVTGSRIVRKDYVAESPIVTLERGVLDAAGPVSLDMTLNQMPQFAANAGANSTSQARGGRANANLRGLGAVRTLVLQDGRRMQPSDPLGGIDLNTISGALLQNVEVITGGASAVYGSDAIAGVVNFRLNDRFTGLVADAQYGATEREDGETLDVSLAAGGPIADGRGHAMFSASYMDRQRVNRGSRDFFADGGITSVLPSGLIYPNAANLPTQAAVSGVFAAYGVTGSVLRSAAFSRNTDGTLFTITNPIQNFRFPEDGLYTITSNNQVALPLGEFAPLLQPLERETLFGRVSYDLTEDVEAYGQFNYTHYTADQTWYGRNQAITRDVYVPVTNPFLPQGLKTIAASRPNPNAPLLLYFNTGRYSPDIVENTYNASQVLGGLRGDLDIIDGGWDVYASFGRTEQNTRMGGYIDRAAFLSLVEAPDGGVSICQGGLDPLAFDRPSQDCLDYLLREMHESTELEQTVAEGSLQGRVFDLPAGEVRFASGLSYRKNTYEFSPDAQRRTGAVLATSLSSPTVGKTSSTEFFLEILAPIARDLPLIRSLDLDLAYRYSDYDSVGGVHTYKAGANWELTDSFSVRGGYQRAIRAPSVGELFQPSEQSGTTVGRISAGLGDPCDVASAYRTGSQAAQVKALCLATGVPQTIIDTHRFAGTSVQSEVSGNRNLIEETADSYTAGLVWRSRFDNPLLSGLTASLDYYEIKITDAIGLITGDVIAQRCFNGDNASNPTYDPQNYYCQLINRGVSGGFSTITTPLLNLAGYETAGADLQVDWRAELRDFGWADAPGELGLNLIVSYTDKYAIQTLAGGAFVDYAGTIGNAQISADAISHPAWKVNTSLDYKIGQARLNLRWRWIDSMDNSANVGAAVASAPGVKAMDYFDLSGTYRLNERVEVRGGVLNIADRQPPAWTGEGATDAALYDVLGRRFYAGVKLSF